MCGYYYSTHREPQHTRNLRRRGPEGWQTRDDELGKFGHALLNTIGEKVHQPLETPHGVLLYNGSVYNPKPHNDALWIADNLTSNVDQCMEFVRTLNGEYSITWVTEQFVIFCTDPFGTRPLYHHQYPDGGIHTASLMDVFSGPQMLCDPNVIYVYHRKQDSIEMHANNTWDLTQRVDSWDQTWESFDRAVMDRHDDSVYAVSGGHDSGVIMASAVKQFGSVLCVNTVPNGEQKILAQRYRINPIQLVPYTSRLAEVDSDELFRMTGNSEIKNKMATCGQTAYIRKVMLPAGRKVLVTGEGGDEIYSDYGHNGTRIRDHSKTGGHFPVNLETAWPWYNNQQVLSRYVGRTEAVGGHWGVELRLPLLDKRLVQAWLNTTHRLKNSGYKSWMAQYMEDHGMPFEPHAKSGYSESATQTKAW